MYNIKQVSRMPGAATAATIETQGGQGGGCGSLSSGRVSHGFFFIFLFFYGHSVLST